jgi:hypothetical protein
MARKSFLKTRKRDASKSKPADNKTEKTTTPALKGDLDGDGDVDWVDKVIAAVQFIQTPRGQCLVLVGAAAFSTAVNLSTYTRSMEAAFSYLRIEWLAPLAWLAAIITYLLLQVLETLPRTGWWDLETKIMILRKLQGLDVPVISNLAGKQTDIVYWQETAQRDYELKRKLMWLVSIGAHAADLWSLWIDFPLWRSGTLFLHPNLWIVLILMFSFEGLVALSQFIKQFTAKPKAA